MAELSKQHWSAARYAATAHFVPTFGAPVVELLDPKPGERILDLGCGDGVLSEKIAAAGAKVIAVDAAPDLLAAARARGLRIIGVGRKGDGIRLVESAMDGFAQTLRIEHGGKDFRVRLPLVGEFQVENALVAAGLAIATDGDPAAVFSALERLTGAKGRLELVGSSRGAPIFIDYAHKPDALAKALEALRPSVSGKLVVVFGAGGRTHGGSGKARGLGEGCARREDAIRHRHGTGQARRKRRDRVNRRRSDSMRAG